MQSPKNFGIRLFSAHRNDVAYPLDRYSYPNQIPPQDFRRQFYTIVDSAAWKIMKTILKWN